MERGRRIGIGAALAVGLALLGVALRAPAREAGATPEAHDDTAVVVELFTSEGCSSCPAADAVLAALAREQPRIVPLAFHVDYWDDLGWPDPFASPAFTRRQRDYANASGERRVYTPEARVDGVDGFVGSDRALAEKAIARAARRPKAKLALARTKDASFALDVGPLASATATADDAVEVVLAVTQTKAIVAVPRGENAGKSLEHTAIVRELRVVGPCPAAGGHFTFDAKTPKGVAVGEARAVVFLQEARSRRILGVATAPLAP
jgi:hypothetical protein